MTGAGPRSRMRSIDRLVTGLSGLIARPGRTLLTAVGVAIGIASMVAVVGISASSKADLLAELDELGTNLLQVRPGQSAFGDASQLPVDAQPMLDQVATVTSTAAITQLETTITRSIHDDTPNGITVAATNGDLTGALQLEPAHGRLIDTGTQQLPVAVLGSVAARRLGIHELSGGPTVSVAGQTFQVVGIMAAHPLHPDLDRTAFVGHHYATTQLGADPNPTTIYLRIRPDRIDQTRPLLARTANPASPSEVQVSRPSDALQAQAKVDQNLQNLLLALGAVALLVGGIGIANIMVISVLERRGEIGLRRALGATKGHIRTQFVIEATALAALGGTLGIAAGTAATHTYAQAQNWTTAIPTQALAIGVAAALALGAIAGLYPATKAARLDPADAIRPHN